MTRIKPSLRMKAGIKKWLLELDSEKIIECPFQGVMRCRWKRRGLEFCHSWFPRTNRKFPCPCYKYPLSTVIRRAKEMLRWWG